MLPPIRVEQAADASTYSKRLVLAQSPFAKANASASISARHLRRIFPLAHSPYSKRWLGPVLAQSPYVLAHSPYSTFQN